MDVLQEIFRSNGRAVNLLQHESVDVGRERGKYFLRGIHKTGTREIVTVYLTDREIDRLIDLRQRRSVAVHVPGPFAQALRGLGLLVRR